MKENIEIRIWKMIAPPVIYTFLQMVMEILFAGVAGLLKFLEVYQKSRIFSDIEKAVAQVQQITEQNTTYMISLSAFAAFLYFGYQFRREQEEHQHAPLQRAEIGWCICLGVSLSLGVSTLLSVMQVDNLYGNYQENAVSLLQGNIIYRLIAVGMLVPATEEIIYRGLVYRRAKREWGKVKAMLFSAAVFGLFHFNLMQGIYAFVLGMVFAYCYEEFDSIKVSIYMHMAINIIAILMDYYGMNKTTGAGSVFQAVLMLLELVIAAYTFDIIKKKCKKRGK